MTTIKTKHGTQYEVWLALRKKGGIKNELVTKDEKSIVAYLAKADRCKEEEIIVSHSEHPDGKGG